ncbi:MAG: type IV secretory system conjugative DNA transfer family protein [Candidatus Komeilibacteria bacterium]
MTDQNYEEQVVAFGVTNYRNIERKFGIKVKDRRNHMYLIGKTGVGKSTMLENMIVQDIQAGRGVAVVDPHGDTVEKIVSYIPTSRINDTIYFNPADINYPFAFNVLEKVDKEHQHLVASGLIGVFRKIWADTWGPRLEYVLRNAILALLEFPDSTLLGIMRMLVDQDYRRKVVGQVTDPVVKSFWIDEYEKYKGNFQVEAIAPIQNKVGAFLSSFLIRNVVGQIKSSIDLRDVMDNKKILLLNLSKGRIGEDNSALLGAMMITKIQLAAMSRVDIPEQQRNDFYMYIDEFQNFATESFAEILSEARKYHLNMILAHQYREQLDERVQAAIVGNVGTLISFRVGADDAEFLEKEFFPQFDKNDLVNLSKYHFYNKLMIDGVTSPAFSAKGLPPLLTGDDMTDNLQKVIKVSRQRYCKQREIIEDKISRWSSTAESTVGGQQSKDKKEDKPGFKANCSRCGIETSVPFKPDGVRPIFCPDCLKLFKAGKISREAIMTNPVSNTGADADTARTDKPKEAISLDQALSAPPTKFK